MCRSSTKDNARYRRSFPFTRRPKSRHRRLALLAAASPKPPNEPRRAFTLNNKSYRRASDNLHFFTLRSPSSSSAVQLVSRDKDVSKDVMEYPLESVVLVQGTVKARRQKAKAISSAVDEIELEVQGVTLLNPADQTLPFYPNRPEVASFIKRLVEEAPLTICVFLFSLFFLGQ